MNLQYNEIELKKKLEQLIRELRSAFADACAERLLHSYAKYSATTGKDDAKVLRELLNCLWHNLGGNQMSAAEIERAIEICEGLIPQDDGDAWVPEQAASEFLPSVKGSMSG